MIDLKRLCRILIATVAVLAAPCSIAMDLSQVYQLALNHNPALESSQSTALANWAQVKQARGLILPSLLLKGTASLGYLRLAPYSNSYYAGNLSLQLTQPLFNLSALGTYSQAGDVALAQDATVIATHQSLAQETVAAYLTVLQDNETLNFDRAQTHYLKQTLQNAKASMGAGLSTDVAVKQAQSNYDLASAQETKDRNQLKTDRIALFTFTGQDMSHVSLAPLKPELPNFDVEKKGLKHWQLSAQADNSKLQALRYQSDAARSEAYSGAADFLPTVSAVATYGIGYNSLNPGPAAAMLVTSGPAQSATVGLQLTWVPFKGGTQFGQLLQYAHQYEAASFTQIATARQLQQSVSSDYLGIQASLSQVNAYKQAVTASAATLKQRETQYQVGTITLDQVLLASKQEYQAKMQYLSAKFAYINTIFALKLDSGTLADKDIRWLNKYLDHSQKA